MRNLKFLFLVSALFVVSNAHAQSSMENSEIELKGIQLGMPKSEVERLIGSNPKSFTIAGIYPKSSVAVWTSFINEKLSKFTFIFDASNFRLMQSAVKEKYPQLACESSEVKNRMGATFEEVKCKINSQSGNFLLSRFYIDLSTSAIVMTSVEEQEKIRIEMEKRKKDI